MKHKIPALNTNNEVLKCKGDFTNDKESIQASD